VTESAIAGARVDVMSGADAGRTSDGTVTGGTVSLDRNFDRARYLDDRCARTSSVMRLATTTSPRGRR